MSPWRESLRVVRVDVDDAIGVGGGAGTDCAETKRQNDAEEKKLTLKGKKFHREGGAL